MSLEIYPILCNAGFMDNYAYVLIDSETKVSAVVDAAEEKPIVEFCQKQDIIPSYILTTHHHEDHTNANLALKKRFNAKVVGSKIEENLILFSRALKKKNVHFTVNDFMNIDISNLDSNDFVYCDPPYLISTGSYNDGNRGFKNWTEREEKQLLNLLDTLNKKGVKFALSNVLKHKGNDNKILSDWSKKYYVTYLDKKYSNCSYHLKNKNAETVEVVVTNYQPQGDRPWQQQTLF